MTRGKEHSGKVGKLKYLPAFETQDFSPVVVVMILGWVLGDRGEGA